MSDITLNGVPMAQRSPEARAQFIQSTYGYLAVAIAVVLTLLTALGSLLTGGWSERVGKAMGVLAGLATGQWILGFFVWFATISDEGFNLFTGLLHPLAMTGVLAVSHMAAGKARRTGPAAMGKAPSSEPWWKVWKTG